MIAEFSITPIGTNSHISGPVAEALKIVDASGLPYQLTPMGTCIEGDWGEVMQVVQRCHQRIRELAPHVITAIKIEDEEGARDKLLNNIRSVESKVGHPLHRGSAREVVTATARA